MTPSTVKCRELRRERNEPANIKGMSWDIIMPKMPKAEYRKRIMHQLNNNPRFKE